MRWSALLSSGRRADAVQAARDLEKAVPDSIVRAMPMVEFFRPHVVSRKYGSGSGRKRFRSRSPRPECPSRTRQHYARGMAYAARGKYAEAQAGRDSILAVVAAFPPDAYWLESGRTGLRFAAAHLDGETALRRGDNDRAIGLLKRPRDAGLAPLRGARVAADGPPVARSSAPRGRTRGGRGSRVS
jgi:hypothetical protein